MTAELLTIETVPGYLAGRPDLAGLIDPATATVREVGDGNLNLVFVVRDAQARSLVVKQALPYVRSDHSWAITEDRALSEARGYEAATRFAPGLTPRYHGLDAPRRLVVIEDLSAWTVWRTALDAGRISPGAGADLGRYVARVAFGTSAFGRRPPELRAAAAEALNPELCRITEDLVFTEPYVEHEHNSWDEEITGDVLGLREDALRDRVAELKYAFVTTAESLVHGDLHTGSVFVPGPDAPAPGPDAPAGSAAKAFDLEFGFYGPVAFDLGALFGNYLLAQARAAVLDRPQEFRDWLAGLAAETWGSFAAELRRLWPTRVDAAYTDAFLEGWLARTWADAVGFGGAKAVRRIVGWAKVPDIQTLDRPERVRAAHATLVTARRWIESRRDLAGPADLAELTAATLKEEAR